MDSGGTLVLDPERARDRRSGTIGTGTLGRAMPKATQFPHVISVMLDDGQYRAYKRYCRAEGRSLSGQTRKLIVDALRGTRFEVKEEDDEFDDDGEDAEEA